MKKIVSLAIAFALVFSLAACGGGTEKAPDFSAQQAVTYLSENLTYDSTPIEQPAAYAEAIAGSTDYVDAAVSAANGSNPDMIAVIKASSPSSAQTILASAEQYLDDMSQEYAKYAPDQVSRIEDAVVVAQKSWVIICIASDNDRAATVVDLLLKSGLSADAAQLTAAPTDNKSDDSTSADTTDTSPVNGTTASSTTATTEPTTTAASTGIAIPATDDYELLNNIFRANDACFECYYYNESNASKYAAAIDSFASSVPSGCHVYDILVPLSSAITLPDNLYDKIPSTDQNESINKATAKLTGNVKSVLLYDAMRAHRDEYIYFRTDHHWTSRGAYYAFNEFCNAKGVSAPALSDYSTVDYTDFLGSFYTDTKSSRLSANPDTITALYPIHNDTISFKFTDSKGNTLPWPIINDVTKYSKNMKYSTFAGGDNPYSEAINTSVTDGSVCIIVKESFGNALVPFLADIYSKVYVIDYRYYTGSLSSLVSSNPNADVLFVNNVSALQSSYLIGKFTAAV